MTYLTIRSAQSTPASSGKDAPAQAVPPPDSNTIPSTNARTAATTANSTTPSITDAPSDENKSNILAKLKDPALRVNWPDYMYSSVKTLLTITDDDTWVETIYDWVCFEDKLGFPTSKVSHSSLIIHSTQTHSRLMFRPKPTC